MAKQMTTFLAQGCNITLLVGGAHIDGVTKQLEQVKEAQKNERNFNRIIHEMDPSTIKPLQQIQIPQTSMSYTSGQKSDLNPKTRGF
jgi:pheromone shutdown protein TraB